VLSWSQENGDTVESYVVSYSASVIGCSNMSLQSMTVLLGGHVQMINITGLEEDSDVEIAIIASNSAGNSSSEHSQQFTLSASKLNLHVPSSIV